jgi:hypothetical protein
MRTSSNPTILVSVAVAIGLWLVATLLEGDDRWLPPEAGIASETRMSSPRQDTPVRTSTDANSCQRVEADLVERVETAQYCTTDDDCTLFDFGYPMQCMTSVAKAEITSLRMAYRDYERSCTYRVYYDCPSGSMERQAVCRNNRCAVDLVSNEPLKDETLRHLGIETQ